jgi:hypothetical protein
MSQDRIETCLREAAEAERNAVTANDASLRSSFLELARGWRKLAGEMQQAFANDDDDEDEGLADLSHG